MRDINWGISFDITINGEEANFSDLTESEQKKILDDLASDYYYGTFLGDEAEIMVDDKTVANETDTPQEKLSAEEFYEKFCLNCGSQRCEGIGTVWFEGCEYKEILKEN